MTNAINSFKKLIIDGNPYFIQFNQNNEGDISLQLTNGNRILHGKLPQREIIQMAKGLDMATSKLENLLVQCLTSKDVEGFEYQLTDQDEMSSKLVLKQVINGGFKFLLGSVFLKTSENSSQRLVSMLDHLTSELAQFKNEVEKLRSTNNTISQEQEHMTQRLKEHVEAQVSMEQELYTKFAMVLNSKKAKIRELKKTIESGDYVKSTKNQQKDDAKRCLVESDEELETDEGKDVKMDGKKRKISSTDDEIDEDERKTNREERGRDEKDTVMEDNIRLDDSIEDNDDLPRRSRKRIRGIKPKTPVNSVLPRTASLPRPKSAQKAATSSSSQRSQRSSRNTPSEITADELLDNL